MILSKSQNITIISKYHHKLAYERYINNHLIIPRSYHDNIKISESRSKFDILIFCNPGPQWSLASSVDFRDLVLKFNQGRLRSSSRFAKVSFDIVLGRFANVLLINSPTSKSKFTFTCVCCHLFHSLTWNLIV